MTDGPAGRPDSAVKLMMFSKHLQAFPVAEAGRAIRGLGFAGVDLTVRPGGHVEPAEVRAKLPEAVAVLRDLGLAVPFLTTAVTAAGDPHAAAVFEAAAALGIRELKLGYWWTRDHGGLAAGLDRMARDLEGIEASARRCGVRAHVHTHSGACASADPVAVWHAIRDRDPAAVGAYLDPGHLVVDGGLPSWRRALELLGPRCAVLAVKDFAWDPAPDPDSRAPRTAKLAPLDRGLVPWGEVFAGLRRSGFAGWVSVHSEYQGADSWRDLTLPELLEQTRADVAYLKRAMDGMAA